MIDHTAELAAIRRLAPLALGSGAVDPDEWLDRVLGCTHGMSVRDYVRQDPAHALAIRQWLAAAAAGDPT